MYKYVLSDETNTSRIEINEKQKIKRECRHEEDVYMKTTKARSMIIWLNL